MGPEPHFTAEISTGVPSGPSGHAPRVPARRAWPLETWLYVLLAVAVATTSVIAFWSYFSVRSLRDAVTQTGLTQSAIQEFEAVGLTRNAIDNDVLSAAAGSPAERSLAAKHAAAAAATVGLRLEGARSQMEAAGAPASLLSRIDAASRSLSSYANTASEVAADLSTNPNQAPAALHTLTTQSSQVFKDLDSVSAAVISYNQATNRSARAVANADFVRVTVVSVLGVLVLIALAVALWRRIRAVKRANRLVEEAEALAARQLHQEVGRQTFDSQLRRGLEMASDEPAVIAIAALALKQLELPGNAVLLLTDDTRSPFRREPAGDPEVAGCDVESPWDCPAMRSATAEIFPDATAIDTCPHLRRVQGGDCGAVCVPLMFGGRGMGVVHVLGPRTPAFSPTQVEMVKVLGADLSMRMGTLRILERTSHEANYDGLTALLTRRALDTRLEELAHEGRQFALAMADLDRFKQINDTYGHEEGDRAFARVRAGRRLDDASRRPGRSLRRRGVRLRVPRHDHRRCPHRRRTPSLRPPAETRGEGGAAVHRQRRPGGVRSRHDPPRGRPAGRRAAHGGQGVRPRPGGGGQHPGRGPDHAGGRQAH